MQVNRYLKDKAMDRIDHALGRPVNPMRESYRSHYAIDSNNPLAEEMRRSPHWIGPTKDGRLSYFYVSHTGRKALCYHLRQIGDNHRLYVVAWNGFEMLQVATSASKARYTKWLSVSDSYDVSFVQFARDVRVRLAQGDR